MDAFFAKIVAVLTSFFTMLSAIFMPAQSPEPEFPEQTAPIVKEAFDEGEFVCGEYDIFVSPDGDDSNPGTIQAPLKTLAGAKELLKTAAVPDNEKITVWFREGTYLIGETVDFTSQDRSNVLYRSYPDEDVAFSGAKQISGWNETTINSVAAFVTDVSVESDEDYFRSLFKGDKRLSRSCYPKTGVFKVTDPKTDEATLPEYEAAFFTHSLVFYTDRNNTADFANPCDVDIRLMHFWCDELMPVHAVYPDTGRIETAKPTSMTIRVDDNFIFENVREALSLPGEWYLDRSEEKLYYIPEPGDTIENTVLYAGMTEQLMNFNGTENIAFQGIDFINTDWNHVSGNHFAGSFDENSPLYANIKYDSPHPQAAFDTPAAIHITASTNIDFTDCRFENISYTAIKFDKGAKNCDITSCLFNEIGANAVFIHGEAVIPASTQSINVTDSKICRYGRIFNNAIGILLTYAGNCELKNNEISEGWYTGISVGWVWGYGDNPTNNINISNNLIYNIGNGWLSDMGAIYTLGVQPDTVIRENIIYNVGCDEGRYGYGGWGIYLDEGSSGMLVENNLVYDCSSQTFHQHYGKDNIVRNNIFAFGEEGAFRITRKEEHNSLTLSNNIIVTDNAMMYALTTERNWFTDDSNLYWDYTNGGNVYSGDSMKPFERVSMVIMTARGYYNNPVFADPLFKDAQNRDFTLALNSPALDTGFEVREYSAGTKTLFE